MEQLINFLETQPTWLFLIGVVIVVFFLISLLKTVVKFAVILLVVSIGAVVLFDIAPEVLTEIGVDSVKRGTVIVQEKVIPMISAGYLGELFEQNDSVNDLFEQLELDVHTEKDAIADMLEENK
ncbi:hypothetical protein ACFFHM_06060 [Halalkalibacter kiskunsagensis]|uniref:Uncharacterized protein n=1 Tax=Halalkalibacter kiskunsagensis TaxID=1548599 RepID=A0ABV6K9V5_9BACI